MQVFDAVILGFIEGVTEFLPISSTGHLILFGKLLSITEGEFLKSFNIAIQLGAILSVVFLFPKRFFKEPETLKKIILAFIPTAILGLIFYSLIKRYLLDNAFVVVVSLFVGGVIFIFLERYFSKKMNLIEGGVENIKPRQAVLIGIFQSLAMVPGVSRSASTIFGGMLLGINRVAIVEFSFLLAVPTMLAATVLDLYKSFGDFTQMQIPVLVAGFVVSFFTAILAIKFLIRFVKNNNFVSFGIYRIIIAIIFFFVFLK